MISILDKMTRKYIKREVTSHLRPAMRMRQESVPSVGNSRGRCLEVGMGLLGEEQARVVKPRMRWGTVTLRSERQAGTRSCKAL